MDTQKTTANETVIEQLLVAYGGKERLMDEILKKEKKNKKPISKEQLERLATYLQEIAPVNPLNLGPQVTEVRYPYEIFTGLQDDDEGIVLPKSVTKGKIIKQTNSDGTKRYDFQFENTRGYKITVEGLSEKFSPEYWNYAKLISGVLRYRMPLNHVIKLVGSLQLQSESINTWKNGVEKALKKYLPSNNDTEE